MFIPTTSSFTTSDTGGPILVAKDINNTPTSSISYEKGTIAIAPRAPTPTQPSSGSAAVPVSTDDSGSIVYDQTTPESTPTAKASAIVIVVPVILGILVFAGLAMVFWYMKKRPSSWRRTDASSETTTAAATAAGRTGTTEMNAEEQNAATATTTKSVRSSFSSTTTETAATAKKAEAKKSKPMPSGGIDMTGGRDSSYSGGRGIV